MIHIEKDQKVAENEELRVATATGDYEDNALIEFYNVNESNVVAGAFAAQFIKYGSLVYKFNDPKELGVEILKIDSSSTHTSASFVRMSNELLSQMNKGSLEPASLDQALATEQTSMEDQREENKNITEETVVTDTEVTNTETVGNTAEVTTPSLQEQDVASTTPQTTTESSHTDVIENTASAINSIEQAVDNISSSAEVISETVQAVTDALSETQTP